MVLGQHTTKSQNSNIIRRDLQLDATLGILALLICALVIIGLLGYRHFTKLKYSQVAYTHCSDKPLNRPHRQSLSKLGIKFISPDDLNILEQQLDAESRTIIYIPCSYNNSDWDIQEFFNMRLDTTAFSLNSHPLGVGLELSGNGTKPSKANNHIRWIIAAVLGCNKICSKNGLWSVLETTYGRKMATKITPESWVIPGQSTAIQQIVKSSGTGTPTTLIFKKNIQGKQGLLITNSPDEIQKLSQKPTTTDKYSVAQRYLAHPYLINGRKLNIRLYILVVVIGSRAVWWLYRAGKCIYTNRQYTPLPPDTTIRSGSAVDMPLLEQHFTSLNLDAARVYTEERCPETLDELRDYMKEHEQDWLLVWKKIQLGLLKVAQAYDGKLTALNKSYCAYQIFGVDYILNKPSDGLVNEITPYLLEFNKGPEMKYKSPYDPVLKSGLQTDILDLVLGKNPDNNDKWIQINSTDKSKGSTSKSTNLLGSNK